MNNELEKIDISEEVRKNPDRYTIDTRSFIQLVDIINDLIDKLKESK